MRIRHATILIGLLLTVSLALAEPVHADCQEGVIHKIIRTVFQVPAAVLKSFQGPKCNNSDSEFGSDYSGSVRYPDLRAVYGPQYRAAGSRTYEPLPKAPEYVTYKVVMPTKETPVPDKETNLHVYGSIPFNNR